MSDNKQGSAHGESNLDVLLKSMQPVLSNTVFVFATIHGNLANSVDINALNPQMIFREAEGTTLIVSREAAIKAAIDYEFPCRMITLNVHSSLDAVGFLARITQKLAALDMGVNPVSGFYHDHLFIPEDRAEDAMAALKQFTDL